MSQPDNDMERRLQEALENRESLPPNGLEPLVRLARGLEQMPKLEAPDGAAERCLDKLDRASLSRTRPRRFHHRGLTVMLATCCLAILIVAAVSVARTSQPGHVMYPVKRASEDIKLMLTTDAEGRAEWCICMSQRRLDEFVAQAKDGKVRAGTLNAMLKSSACAQAAAERAEDNRRGALIAQVGELCQMQGAALENTKVWVSSQDTAVLNSTIAKCMSRCRACEMCPVRPGKM